MVKVIITVTIDQGKIQDVSYERSDKVGRQSYDMDEEGASLSHVLNDLAGEIDILRRRQESRASDLPDPYTRPPFKWD